MYRYCCLLLCIMVAILLAGCSENGCRLTRNSDQPSGEILLQSAESPNSWRGLQPGSSSQTQVNTTLSTMPEVIADSIFNDQYILTQGSKQQTVEKVYFNFSPGNNQRQELFFSDGTLELINFTATNVTLAQALDYYGEPQWLLSTNFCEDGFQARADQIDLLYPSQGIVLKLFGVFSEGIELQGRCYVGYIYLFAPDRYEEVLLSQIQPGYYLDPQVRAQRLEELSQRMQTWQGMKPINAYTTQPCPP